MSCITHYLRMNLRTQIHVEEDNSHVERVLLHSYEHHGIYGIYRHINTLIIYFEIVMYDEKSMSSMSLNV